jgi:peptidoglycan/LPS O-acetylase OafA/YrhL
MFLHLCVFLAFILRFLPPPGVTAVGEDGAVLSVELIDGGSFTDELAGQGDYNLQEADAALLLMALKQTRTAPARASPQVMAAIPATGAAGAGGPGAAAGGQLENPAVMGAALVAIAAAVVLAVVVARRKNGLAAEQSTIFQAAGTREGGMWLRPHQLDML